MIRKLAIAAAIVAATTLAAEARPHDREQRRDRMERMAEELQLSDAQKDAIKAIHQEARAANQQLHAQIREKAREYVELSEKNDSRADEVKSELREMREELAIRRLATQGEVERVLTPEQREKFEQMKSRRHEERGGKS